MTVSIDLTRKAVNVAWDPGANTTDPVTLVATNPDTGDESDRKGLVNDGLAVVTYPADYSGTSHIDILGPDGEVVDSGDIDV